MRSNPGCSHSFSFLQQRVSVVIPCHVDALHVSCNSRYITRGASLAGVGSKTKLFIFICFLLSALRCMLLSRERFSLLCLPRGRTLESQVYSWLMCNTSFPPVPRYAQKPKNVPFLPHFMSLERSDRPLDLRAALLLYIHVLLSMQHKFPLFLHLAHSYLEALLPQLIPRFSSSSTGPLRHHL